MRPSVEVGQMTTPVCVLCVIRWRRTVISLIRIYIYSSRFFVEFHNKHTEEKERESVREYGVKVNTETNTIPVRYCDGSGWSGLVRVSLSCLLFCKLVSFLVISDLGLSGVCV